MSRVRGWREGKRPDRDKSPGQASLLEAPRKSTSNVGLAWFSLSFAAENRLRDLISFCIRIIQVARAAIINREPQTDDGNQNGNFEFKISNECWDFQGPRVISLGTAFKQGLQYSRTTRGGALVLLERATLPCGRPGLTGFSSQTARQPNDSAPGEEAYRLDTGYCYTPNVHELAITTNTKNYFWMCPVLGAPCLW